MSVWNPLIQAWWISPRFLYGTTNPNTPLVPWNEWDEYYVTPSWDHTTVPTERWIFDDVWWWVLKPIADSDDSLFWTTAPTTPTGYVIWDHFFVTPSWDNTTAHTEAWILGTTWWYQIQSPATCPDPMTRWQLLALRNSSQLDIWCHYVMTWYNRGTVWVATILLHAVDVNVLSLKAEIKTTHDNIAWTGKYDIDTNRIISLEDNLDNKAYWQAQVDAFPWGVTTVYDTTNYFGTFTYTAWTVYRTTIWEWSRYVHSGWTWYDNKILWWSFVTFTSWSNLRNTFDNDFTYNQAGTWYIRYSNAETNWSFTNGNVNISNTKFVTWAVWNTTWSTWAITNSQLGYTVTNALQNIASLTISQSNLSSWSSITATWAAYVYIYRSESKWWWRFLVTAGKSLYAVYCEVNSYWYIQVTDGRLNARYCTSNSLGYISHQSTWTNTTDRAHVSSQANMRFTGTTNWSRIYYSKSDSWASIYINNWTNDYFYYVHWDSASQIYTQNKTNSRMYYLHASASSYIRSYNWAWQSIMYYSSATARWYVEHSNIWARLRYYGITAQAQSIFRMTWGTVASNIYYSSLFAYYYILGTPGWGTKYWLHWFWRQTFSWVIATNWTWTRNWT